MNDPPVAGKPATDTNGSGSGSRSSGTAASGTRTGRKGRSNSEKVSALATTMSRGRRRVCWRASSPVRYRGRRARSTSPRAVALKIYVHIADEQDQVAMRQLTERRQAAGRPAKPARGRQGISKVSAKSRRSTMTRFSRSPGNRAYSLRRSSPNGEGGIRTRGPAFDRTRL